MTPRKTVTAQALLAGVAAVVLLLISHSAKPQTQGNGPAQLPNYQVPTQTRAGFPSHVSTVNPANPTGTASATPTMAGLGAAAAPCVFTPVYSQSVRAEIYGTYANATSGSGMSVIGKYGTGTAPANAAALTGTSFSPTVSGTSSAVNAPEQFYVAGHITGLVLGTAIWIDVGQADITSGTASLTNVQCNLNEE